MRVWINNPFDFLPGEGARLQRYGLLCRALVQAGHQVVWWTSDWNHLEKVRREVLKFEPASLEATPSQGSSKVLKLEDGQVEIRLIKTMPYFKNVGLRRLVSHWLYAKRWERMALAEPEHPDLILCSAPPLSTGWVMRHLCKRLRCAGVIDVMDLWPETFERVAPAWMLWPLRWMAKRVYQGADGISAVGDSYLEVIREKYQSAVAVGSREARDKRKEERTPRQGKPMYRCYHGVEEVAVGSSSWQLGKRAASYDATSAKAPSPHCPLPLPTANLKLVYVGNMGQGYDLETLVRAVSEMMDEGYAIGLDLAGRGEQEPLLKTLAEAKKHAICFHGMVSGEQLYALLGQADLGVVPMFSNTLVAVPYKLADYAAYGLPMVSSLHGETSALLKQYACGWQYEAGSLASLKQALKEVYELKQREAAAFEARGRNARRLAEECFAAERIYPAFVRWLIETTKWSQ